MLRQRPRKYLPDWRKQKPNLANHICRTYCLISDIKTEPWQTVVYRAGDILKYKLKTEYNEIYQEDIRQRSVPFSSQNLRFPVMLWQFCTGLPGVNFRSSADRTRCRTLQRERTGWGIRNCSWLQDPVCRDGSWCWKKRRGWTRIADLAACAGQYRGTWNRQHPSFCAAPSGKGGRRVQTI